MTIVPVSLSLDGLKFVPVKKGQGERFSSVEDCKQAYNVVAGPYVVKRRAHQVKRD